MSTVLVCLSVCHSYGEFKARLSKELMYFNKTHSHTDRQINRYRDTTLT